MSPDLIRRDFQEITRIIINGINSYTETNPLFLECSFQIGHKTISEIGGRFLEEYILLAIKNSFHNDSKYELGSLSSRSLGDFVIRSKDEASCAVYFDVKAQHLSIRDRTLEHYKLNNIKQKKPGESHPNLISYQKAIEFYTDQSKKNNDIAMILVKYDPTIINGKTNFNIKELESESIVLLRDLGEKNLSYGDLGKGQIQLSRINTIEVLSRSKHDFVKLIEGLKNRPRKLRNSPKV
jgi:hypothetical protein